MGEANQRRRQTPSRLGMRSQGGGEIVEVEGGHIVRSTGRKDRHSKVCTAKGTRDRRVRLSAHTAIQFYDVQDRLGYDRPSKAVDWLINKAKAAIDELEELPPWKPTMNSPEAPNSGETQIQNQQDEPLRQLGIHGGGGATVNSFLATECDNQNQQQQIRMSNQSFMGSFPQSEASAEANPSPVQFHNFPTPDFSSQRQDLKLSLQSFQDPRLLHHQHHHSQHHTEQSIFSGTSALEFDALPGGWSEHHQPEINRFQRVFAWNAGGDSGTGCSGGDGGFIFNSPPTPPLLQPLFGHNQFVSQRGPLQSSNTQSIRAWIDPSSSFATTTTNRHQSPPSFPSIGFASVGKFSGFHIPARIQGEEDEEHDGVSDKPSSASSDSHH